MKALFVAVVLSLPALAQTSKPSQPAEKAAAEQKAEAAKKLFEALQGADPAQRQREVALREVLEKALAAQAAQIAQPAMAAQRADLLERAILFQALAGAEPPKPSPLLHGDYAAALRALDAARQKMLAAEDAEAAFTALDEATKALMDARSALWKQKEAAKQPPAAKPAKTEDGKDG